MGRLIVRPQDAARYGLDPDELDVPRAVRVSMSIPYFYRPIRGPITMLTALFAAMMEAHDARYIEDSEFVRTIPIPNLGVGTVDFDLTCDRSRELFDSGRRPLAWNT